MIRRLGVTLASVLLLYGTADADGLTKNSGTSLSSDLAGSNYTKEPKKIMNYNVLQETRESGIDVNAKAGKITYSLENENSSLIMQSVINSRGSYIKAKYGRGNSRIDFLARILFINPYKIIKEKSSPFTKPEITIEAKLSFPLYLPF